MSGDTGLQPVTSDAKLVLLMAILHASFTCSTFSGLEYNLKQQRNLIMAKLYLRVA